MSSSMLLYLLIGSKEGVGIHTLATSLKSFYNVQLSLKEALICENAPNGILLVFDISDHSSFEALPTLFSQLSTSKFVDIPIYVIGNKIDKSSKITKEEVTSLTKKYNISGYYEGIAACLVCFH